jgi:Zn-dependent peptidase ImmA (M78 family)
MAVVRLAPKNVAPTVPGQEVRSLPELHEHMHQRNLDTIPLDIFKVVDSLGLRLSFQQMDNDMSGFLERQGSQWVVGINSSHNIVRQRFTAAHEIAHYVLHRGLQQRFADVTFARRSNDRNQMERQADNFSASLLMPEEAVNTLVRSGVGNLNELANRFQVSPLAMKYRLVNLNYAIS